MLFCCYHFVFTMNILSYFLSIFHCVSASSKHFVPSQKLILPNTNHLFVGLKILVTATICKYIFGLAQKMWTSTKHFGTCKRSRYKCFFQTHIARTKTRGFCEFRLWRIPIFLRRAYLFEVEINDLVKNCVTVIKLISVDSKEN